MPTIIKEWRYYEDILNQKNLLLYNKALSKRKSNFRRNDLGQDEEDKEEYNFNSAIYGDLQNQVCSQDQLIEIDSKQKNFSTADSNYYPDQIMLSQSVINKSPINPKNAYQRDNILCKTISNQKMRQNNLTPLKNYRGEYQLEAKSLHDKFSNQKIRQNGDYSSAHKQDYHQQYQDLEKELDRVLDMQDNLLELEIFYNQIEILDEFGRDEVISEYQQYISSIDSQHLNGRFHQDLIDINNRSSRTIQRQETPRRSKRNRNGIAKF
ncbi:UNKNOWN [Stylonychia lemnae]|uniref:Uncharacterized protein n=1 Tax=Stylonychia lemnae TaxID=5949 RepID=A0A078A8C7_STYLE|nr:UNKNOWN [Stylonychia lemnae]|eukprot:CDW78479.1 UNKNOWN [Stylonychia lemnae]